MLTHEPRALSQASLLEHMPWHTAGTASTTPLSTCSSASSLPAQKRTHRCDSPRQDHFPSCSGAASTEAPSEDEVDHEMFGVAELRVRNTFLEYHVNRTRPRADSAPAWTGNLSCESDASCQETLTQSPRPSSASNAPSSSSHVAWSRASESKASSLSVQKAVRVAVSKLAAPSAATRAKGSSDLQFIIGGLRGNELKAARHSSANYVLQVLLELAQPAQTAFVAEAMLGHVVDLSRDNIGCRVVVKVLRHLLPAGIGAAVQLADEVASSACHLSNHKFGNYVVQELLEHGTTGHRLSIASALYRGSRGDALLENAMSPFATCVVQKAMVLCPADVAWAMICHLGQSSETLAKNKFGRYVLKTARRLLPAEDELRISLCSHR